jgi:hypothetical protein
MLKRGMVKPLIGVIENGQSFTFGRLPVTRAPMGFESDYKQESYWRFSQQNPYQQG